MECKKQFLRLVFSYTAVCVAFADYHTVVDAEEPAASTKATSTKAIDSFDDATVISDLSAEQMAREILSIQQQLGGSVVRPAQAPTWPNPNDQESQALVTDQQHSLDGTSQLSLRSDQPSEHAKKVITLREVAFGLDSTAHQLEMLDLYKQADSLRQVAEHMRQDARRLNQESKKRTFHAPPRPQHGPRAGATRK